MKDLVCDKVWLDIGVNGFMHFILIRFRLQRPCQTVHRKPRWMGFYTDSSAIFPSTIYRYRASLPDVRQSIAWWMFIQGAGAGGVEYRWIDSLKHIVTPTWVADYHKTIMPIDGSIISRDAVCDQIVGFEFGCRMFSPFFHHCHSES